MFRERIQEINLNVEVVKARSYFRTSTEKCMVPHKNDILQYIQVYLRPEEGLTSESWPRFSGQYLKSKNGCSEISQLPWDLDDSFVDKYHRMKIIKNLKYESLDYIFAIDSLRRNFKVPISILSTKTMAPNCSDQRLRFEKISLNSPKLADVLASSRNLKQNKKTEYQFPGDRFLKKPQLRIENETELHRLKNSNNVIEKKS